MKLIFSLLFSIFTLSTFGQKLEWIPFNWVGDSISGKYYDKLIMVVPMSIDNLPHNFNMQLDLGAIETVIYGNSISPYLEKYPKLKSKIDTSLTFWMQNQKNFKFKNIDLKLGSVSFGSNNIGHFKNFGDDIPRDSIMTKSEKHIGTIAPDLFQDKVLIIDYPNKRICVSKELPKQYANASFQPYKIKEGRIRIPFLINDKEEDLMFDTGSSLFSLITTQKRAFQISNEKVVDSLKISSWGEYYMVYGRKVNSKIKFGELELSRSTVFYDNIKKNDKFYDDEKIWGITGNAYFFNNIVIVDYKNKRFGVQ
jgi:hypothetical protein